MPQMNFYWGDSPMSWLRWMTLASFRLHNPKWGITLWSSPVEPIRSWTTHERQEYLDYDGEDWRGHLDVLGIEHATCDGYGSANKTADICRWKVLAEGGIFADMDIIFTAPMVPLEGDCLTIEDGLYYLGLASGKRGGFFAPVYEESTRELDGGYQSCGVDVLYRMKPDLSDVKVIPYWLVHPWLIPPVLDNEEPHHGSIGIHWYAGHPDSQVATRTWTPQSLPTHGAVARAVREVWGEIRG